MGWKRASAGLAVVASLALGSTVAVGAEEGADQRPTIEVSEVTIALSWETCSELPEGTVIEGAGTLTSATTERPTGGGATAVNNVSVAMGSATDQVGNTYSWFYDNRYWASNTVEGPTAFAGMMVDRFLLSGDGPAFLDNGFAADYSYDTSDETAIRIIPWHQWGDPLDFERLETHCDPL